MWLQINFTTSNPQSFFSNMSLWEYDLTSSQSVTPLFMNTVCFIRIPFTSQLVCVAQSSSGDVKVHATERWVDQEKEDKKNDALASTKRNRNVVSEDNCIRYSWARIKIVREPASKRAVIFHTDALIHSTNEPTAKYGGNGTCIFSDYIPKRPIGLTANVVPLQGRRCVDVDLAEKFISTHFSLTKKTMIHNYWFWNGWCRFKLEICNYSDGGFCLGVGFRLTFPQVFAGHAQILV